jgi:predicted unusual protein kinase regulating ubiquinone biosynthesis (AarF/ABC1/UbiB family)
MAKRSGGAGSAGEARTVALTQEFGAQLRRMGDAGAKITQLLSMVERQRVSQIDAPSARLGTLPEEREQVAWRRLRGVIEQDLDARVEEVFADCDEKPFAIASIGQVHRARDVEHVAVKVQQPGIADSIARDPRNIGLVTPILKRLAPGSDAGALLSEVRERITDELDYEIEAQHQRRLAWLFRGHPHVYVPRVHTDLSTQRVLVTEYVDGLRLDEIARPDEAQSDRIGEIVLRFFFGLVWREHLVAGDPHPDNCLLCQDRRVCLLDFGLLRDLDAAYLQGERGAMRAVVNGDPHAVDGALEHLGYLAKSEAYDPAGLLEHLATVGERFLAEGFRRINPSYVRRTLRVGLSAALAVVLGDAAPCDARSAALLVSCSSRAISFHPFRTRCASSFYHSRPDRPSLSA